LIFGSPVPGYAAPQDTIGPASRTPIALVAILVDGVAAGTLSTPDRPPAPESLRIDAARLRDSTFPGVPEDLLILGMIGWIHLFGAVSFELFGQLNNAINARREAFGHQMRLMADMIGLPEPA
jgi:Tetracyclin repressor-like, C-terminal domain